MRLVFWALGIFFVIVTIFPLIRSFRWWVRASDFPRLQIAAVLGVLLFSYLLVFGVSDVWDGVYVAAVAAALGLQLFRIFPFTFLAPKQVVKASPRRAENCIKVMISNVLMENRKIDALLAVVQSVDPDLLLLVETDDWWHSQLETLDAAYPHRIKQPQNNYYGMELFSKFELDANNVRYLVSDEIPSIRTGVRLPSGNWVEFYGLHPRPPDFDHDSGGRDAEILLVAKEMKASERASIVAGDLNDVAWSHTTRLFQRISGALDPRRGRGMFNTFHAGHRFLRWPLDHIFHEDAFVLVELKRLANIGSDHFPVLAELQYDPKAKAIQEAPKADRADRDEAGDMIDQGKAQVDR